METKTEPSLVRAESRVVEFEDTGVEWLGAMIRKLFHMTYFEFAITLIALIAARDLTCDEPLPVFLSVTFVYRILGQHIIALLIVSIVPRRFPWTRKILKFLSRVGYFAFLIVGQVWYSRVNECDPLRKYLTLIILIQQLYLFSFVAIVVIIGIAVVDGGQPHSSASIETIRKLKQEVVDLNSEDQCSICIENFREGETATHLPCKHRFHPCCVEPWLLSHDSCPLCRASVESALPVV